MKNVSLKKRKKLIIKFHKTIKKRIVFSSFLNSCFDYYEKEIYNNNNNKKKKKTNNNIKNNPLCILLTSGPIYIIDFANIIHILHETYMDIEKVTLSFYSFLLRELTLANAKIIIIAKLVLTKDQTVYTIEHILSQGMLLTQKDIPERYFQQNQLIIYELSFKQKITSSVDDLLGYFLIVIIYVFLLRMGEEDEITIVKKLFMITNDTQGFEKNLFGKTKEQEKRLLFLTRILPMERSINRRQIIKTFIKSNFPRDEQKFRSFLNTYVLVDTYDTFHLDCFIKGIIHKLKFLTSRSTTPMPSFLISHAEFITKVAQISPDLCSFPIRIADWSHVLYLYTLIKCIQYKLFQGNMFGSFSKKVICQLFY